VIRKIRDRNLHTWMGGYLAHLGRRALAGRPPPHRHLLFALCDHYEPHWGQPSDPVAAARVEAWRVGYPEMAAGLRDARLLLGIASNAQFYTPLLFPALTGQELSSFGFRRELCGWSYRLGQAKPSEAIFRPVLEVLLSGFGISPAQVLYVGNDMLKDVRPAHDLGIRTVLFAGDQRSLRERRDEPLCRGLEPDAVITRLDQVPGMLSR